MSELGKLDVEVTIEQLEKDKRDLEKQVRLCIQGCTHVANM